MKKNTTLKAVLALAVTMTMASADAAVFERDFSTSGSDITDWTIIDANSDATLGRLCQASRASLMTAWAVMRPPMIGCLRRHLP